MKPSHLIIIATFLLVNSLAFADDLKPRWISKKSGRVELPANFLKAVKSDYPSLRVPTGKDITGIWKEGFSFAAWSDFSGDGLTDIAIILVSGAHQKQVIYHQNKDGSFVYAHPVSFKGLQSNKELGSPQQMYVQVHSSEDVWLVRRETNEMDAKGYRSQKEERYWIKHDGVIFGIYESGFSLTYWHDGKYRTLGSGVD